MSSCVHPKPKLQKKKKIPFWWKKLLGTVHRVFCICAVLWKQYLITFSNYNIFHKWAALWNHCVSQDISNLSILTQMIVWRKRLICDVKCYLMDVTVSKEIKISHFARSKTKFGLLLWANWVLPDGQAQIIPELKIYIYSSRLDFRCSLRSGFPPQGWAQAHFPKSSW